MRKKILLAVSVRCYPSRTIPTTSSLLFVSSYCSTIGRTKRNQYLLTPTLTRSSTSFCSPINESAAAKIQQHQQKQEENDKRGQQLKTTEENKQQQKQHQIAGSRRGLDPYCNRFHAPIVYHENYSFANWPENHTFPVRFTFL
jgi:hypothetical protein